SHCACPPPRSGGPALRALVIPIQLRSLNLDNRIMVAPMCQYSSVDGEANDWHFTHINSLALSGAAIFCIEATAVEATGRITPGCLGLYNDATEAALKPILASVRKRSKAAVMIQLAHAGRKASSHTPWDGGQLIPVAEGGWRAEGPSAIPHKASETPPVALDAAGLKRVREAFVAATKRAERLGIGYQVPFAKGIREATGLPTIAVGLITEARQAEEIVASGKADMVALARAMLYDPRWGWHAAAELGGEVFAPPQYWRSQPSTQKALFGATTFGTR